MIIPDTAFWIGSDHAFDLQETYLNFRRDIVFESVPQSAKLIITADSRYRLWVNGHYVCRGPARSWPQAQQMDEVEIAPCLVSGVNRIAVQVYCPGYSHFASVHRGACGLLAWMEVDGSTVLVTDQSWRVQRDLSWDPLVPRISIYGSGIERRDLAADRNWQSETPDSDDWKIPRLVSPANGPIWSGLKLRDVPVLTEEKHPLSRIFQFRLGPGAPYRADPHGSLRMIYPNTVATPAPDMPLDIPSGQTAIWIFDLGASETDVAGAELTGLKGGETLLVSYAEKLRDGDLVLSGPATYCRMRPTDVFALRKGAQIAESFSQRGARYLIFAMSAPAPVTVTATFYIRRTRYPLPEKPLAITDPRDANIAALCRTTVLNCLQDGFVDSVWRESSQWLGDCVAQAFALNGLSDDARPLRRAIVMAAEGAYPDGILPSVLPGEVHAYTVTDYNFSWIELLDLYHTHPGNTEGTRLIAVMMPVMAKMLARFRADLDENGLLRSQPGRRLFLDWSGVDRQEPNLTYNGRYLHALQLAARLADVFGETALSRLWRDQADALADAMRQVFETPDGWHENPYGATASQLGLALLILTGMIEGPPAQTAAEAIIARSLDLDDGNSPEKLVLASPFMHHYVFLALEKIGQAQAITDIIRARWGRWAEAGEVTTWENWNTDFPDGSRCHGFSAHPLGWIVRLNGLSRKSLP
ncbi:MAG: hypothetical protein RIR97_935 [Pseudomonadota bacterium]